MDNDEVLFILFMRYRKICNMICNGLSQIFSKGFILFRLRSAPGFNKSINRHPTAKRGIAYCAIQIRMFAKKPLSFMLRHSID